ncbi:MAG: DUF3343 domain-containing protein [Firmicutes bacterium]|nr:DUF3343 domain-containing protein [Bacillota bacterium]
MVNMYVLVGSVTTAMRLKKLLEQRFAFSADVVHTPSQIHHGDCSYSVRTDLRALPAVKSAVSEYGVGIRGMYDVKNVNGERVFYAVS